MTPQEILAYFGGASLIVSSFALIFTGYNSLATRRNTENNRLFEVWDRYDRHCDALASAETDQAKNVRFIAFLNYIENICFLHNKHRFSNEIASNIKSMVADFIDSVEETAPIFLVVEGLSTRSTSYEEIKIFIHNNDGFIKDRKSNSK